MESEIPISFIIIYILFLLILTIYSIYYVRINNLELGDLEDIDYFMLMTQY